MEGGAGERTSLLVLQQVLLGGARGGGGKGWSEMERKVGRARGQKSSDHHV